MLYSITSGGVLLGRKIYLGQSEPRNKYLSGFFPREITAFRRAVKEATTKRFHLNKLALLSQNKSGGGNENGARCYLLRQESALGGLTFPLFFFFLHHLNASACEGANVVVLVGALM